MLQLLSVVRPAACAGRLLHSLEPCPHQALPMPLHMFQSELLMQSSWVLRFCVAAMLRVAGAARLYEVGQTAHQQ
jgi:hypothetical protein